MNARQKPLSDVYEYLEVQVGTDMGTIRRNDRLNNEAEAREQLGGISRTTLYQLFGRGELLTVKIGRRRMVPQSEINRFIERNLR